MAFASEAVKVLGELKGALSDVDSKLDDVVALLKEFALNNGASSSSSPPSQEEVEVKLCASYSILALMYSTYSSCAS